MPATALIGSRLRRLAGWLVCGPLGHAMAGAADVAALVRAARRRRAGARR